MPYRTEGLTQQELDAVKARRRESQRKYYLANKQKCIDASMLARSKDPERHKAVQAEYRAREAEKIKAYSDAYTKENSAKRNVATRKWQMENADRFSAYQKEYRERSAAKERERAGAWKKANADHERARLAKWAHENKGKRCINEQNRRERKRSGEGCLSTDLAARLMALQQGKCACCCVPLNDGYHLDHIMPLALGGPHEDGNIQLLCQTCNLSKHAQHPVDFMQKRGFLL